MQRSVGFFCVLFLREKKVWSEGGFAQLIWLCSLHKPCRHYENPVKEEEDITHKRQRDREVEERSKGGGDERS